MSITEHEIAARDPFKDSMQGAGLFGLVKIEGKTLGNSLYKEEWV